MPIVNPSHQLDARSARHPLALPARPQRPPPPRYFFLPHNQFQKPPINLHLSITTRDDRRPNPRLLQLLSQLLTYPLTPNLTSLKINIIYYTQNYTRQILHPLKAILCYAPNLQKLFLDIWYHRGASGPGTLDEKYFGFGFTSAEKLATKRLKHLTIHAYPFGRPAVAGELNWNTEG
ncbi:hypothetical protein QC764_502890 [Podospora pseudoanserina]|uniref:Uncharacterized protein n=1 Tax=Podospora pseudoanserina TaxID=2609844 RepID=A0ABR0I481_9PEZI|nr:hypothetical protein QC764_502890 [Podospora pseudoanserina]